MIAITPMACSVLVAQRMAVSVVHSPSSALTQASHADHPRFLEALFGRLLELMVYSVEGVRDRLHRTSVH